MIIDIITHSQAYTVPSTKTVVMISIAGGSGGGTFDGWKGGISVDVINDHREFEYEFVVGSGSSGNTESDGGFTRAGNSMAIGGRVGPHDTLKNNETNLNDYDRYITYHGQMGIGKFGNTSSGRYIIFDDDVVNFIENSLPKLKTNAEWLKIKSTISAQSDLVDFGESREIIEYDINGKYKPGAAGLSGTDSTESTSGVSGLIIVIYE